MWAYVNGKKQFQIAANQGSQADGTFVLGGLAAGRYYLSAEKQNDNFYQDSPEQFGRKGPREYNVRTYFPSILDPASAAAVDVTPGADLRGIEIHVRRVRVFEILGVITNSSGRVFTTASYCNCIRRTGLISAGIEEWREPIRTVIFSSRMSLPAPTRFSQMVGSVPKTQRASSPKKHNWRHGSKSIENLAVQLSAGLEIRGHFTTEGPAQIPDRPRRRRFQRV